jgi:adenine-specific DNA-methyltransferase
MKPNQKLELNWIGKGEEPKLEPRILIEQPEYSYGDPGSCNMLIQGDNLLALKALEQDYAGKVKCIYIDPPYNTGNAFEHYEDGIEHSLWLNLMAPRLKILRDLLSNDGSIWISIDDNEAHYLKVIMDEIFGRKNFVANVIWEKRTSRENRRVFSFNHDHLIVYGKDKSQFEGVRNPLGLSSEVLSRYKNPDNDPRGDWQSVAITAQAGHGTASQFYTITTPNGRKIDLPPGNCWRFTKLRLDELIKDNRIYFGLNGNNVPRQKKFLLDNNDSGLTPETIWPAAEVGTNDDAKKAQIQLLPDIPVFDNPKPEGLLERVIHIASNPDDLVLDSFLGSGTTAAVAHKMGRKWIGIELGEHAKTHCYPRLKQVVDGTDQGGISKAVGWQGGGGFRFYTLAPSLLNKDKYGNWIISKKYNPDMLAAAMAKQEGFRYLPDEHVYWKQARSSEKDFLFTTTGFMTVEMLDGIHEEMQPDESLLLACKAYQKECSHRYPNISIKKIPNMLLGRCEFGREDYSLNIVQVPYDRAEEEVPDEPELDIESEEAEESRQTDLFE